MNDYEFILHFLSIMLFAALRFERLHEIYVKFCFLGLLPEKNAEGSFKCKTDIVK